MDQLMGWVGGGMFALVGLAMLLFALHLFKQSRGLVSSGAKVEAEIILKSVKNDVGDMVDKTFFHFRDSQGKPLDIETPPNVSFGTGEKVMIYHLPGGNPYPYKLDTFDDLWSTPLWLAASGMMFLIVGGVVVGFVVFDAPGELLVGTVFASIGLMAAAGGVFAYSFESKLISEGLKTEGVVAGFKKVESTETDNSGRTIKTSADYAEVTFKTDQGNSVTFRSKGLGREKVSVGDKLPVIYPPKDPREARVNSFKEIWMPTVVCAGIVVLFGGVGVLLLTIYLRSRGQGG